MDINFYAVLVGVAFCMVFGFVWYGAMSAPWMKALGITKNDVQESGLSMTYAIIASTLCSSILAFALAMFGSRLGITTTWQGAALGLGAWVGFNFTTTLKLVYWEDRPWRLFWIDGGYDVLSFIVVGGIVGGWQ